MFGFGKIASKIFGSSNEKAIKSVLPIVTKINDLEKKINLILILTCYVYMLK